MSSAIDRIPAPSRAHRVTLFEDRAEVTRAAEASVVAGSSWIAVGGVSPFVDERSVQIKAEGARVLSARVHFHTHHEKTLGREAIEALEDEVRAARRREGEVNDAHTRAKLSLKRAQTLGASFCKLLAAAPRGATPPGMPWPASPACRRRNGSSSAHAS